MRNVRPGDIVEVDKGGVRFRGEVIGKAAGTLDLEPLAGSCPATVRPGQVKTVWRKVRK